MSLDRIYDFLIRALTFASIITLIYVLLGYLFKRKKLLLKSIFVFYLATLFEITTLRGYYNLFELDHSDLFMGKWQLVPLYYTFRGLQVGWWEFIYPFFGNILWFIPLGLLLPLVYSKIRSINVIVIIVLAVSLSIEVIQWILNTGISDIDDIIFNLIGGLIGYFLAMKIIKVKGENHV